MFTARYVLDLYIKFMPIFDEQVLSNDSHSLSPTVVVGVTFDQM